MGAASETRAYRAGFLESESRRTVENGTRLGGCRGQIQAFEWMWLEALASRRPLVSQPGSSEPVGPPQLLV